MKRRDFLFLLTAPALALRGVQEIVCVPTFPLPYTTKSFTLGYTTTSMWIEPERYKIMRALAGRMTDQDDWFLIEKARPGEGEPSRAEG